MGDKTGTNLKIELERRTQTNLVAHKSRQIGSNIVHLLKQVVKEASAVLHKGINTLGKVLDVDEIDVGNLHA